MPSTFLAELGATVDQFDRAIQASEMDKAEHIGARADIEAALMSGMVAVKWLDVIVSNQLRTDPVTMAVWKQARRIGYHHRDAAVPPDLASNTPSAPGTAPDVVARG